MEWCEGHYKISTDKALLSLDRVCDLLAGSYWASTRPRSAIAQSIENSLCYGVYCDDYQIGFARVITDFATTYYICDVIIDKPYRGRGLGKQLMECILGTKNFISTTGLLVTSDAHGLYRQFGFSEPENVFMMRRGTPASEQA